MHGFVRVGVLGCVLALAAGLTASGQGANRVFHDDKAWQVITLADGCRVILGGVELEAAWRSDSVSFRWSGACGPDKLITGPGTLTTEFTTEGTRYRVERSGAVDGGLFQGRSQEAIYSNADDFDDATPAGSMQLHDFGDFRNPQPSHYVNGCSYFVDEKGAADMSRALHGCEPARGLSLRKSLGGSGEGAERTADAGSGGGAQCAMTPEESLQRFNAEFGKLNSQYPMKVSAGAGGVKATFQWSYFIGSEALKILEPYRECMGPHFAGNEAQLKEMRDAGQKGCAQTSTTGTCELAYPFATDK